MIALPGRRSIWLVFVTLRRVREERDGVVDKGSSLAAGTTRTSGAIRVAPRSAVKYPSPASTSHAVTTVPREIPSRSAKTREEGNGSPAHKTPRATRSRTWLTSCSPRAMPEPLSTDNGTSTTRACRMCSSKVDYSNYPIMDLLSNHFDAQHGTYDANRAISR